MKAVIRTGDVIHIITDGGTERDVIVTHVERHIITMADLHEKEKDNG